MFTLSLMPGVYIARNNLDAGQKWHRDLCVYLYVFPLPIVHLSGVVLSEEQLLKLEADTRRSLVGIHALSSTPHLQIFIARVHEKNWFQLYLKGVFL